MIPYHEDEIVDIDGMVQNKDDFYQHYGWALGPEECTRMQIVLHNRTFSVMAAYSTQGFLCWEIYEETVTGSHVVRFLQKLENSQTLPPHAYMILDNASNQSTQDVKDEAERVFEGRYRYCAKYSPELKPVERGFANIKQYIRERDQDLFWQSDPGALIEAAFFHYSTFNNAGDYAKNHFSIYRDNHVLYVSED